MKLFYLGPVNFIISGNQKYDIKGKIPQKTHIKLNSAEQTQDLNDVL